MARETQINAACDGPTAREVIAGVFAAHDYTIDWTTDWSGAAERGSKGKSIALGAMAKTFMRMLIRISSLEGGVAIAIASDTTGMSGGLIGVRRTSKEFVQIEADLRSAFEQRGVALYQ